MGRRALTAFATFAMILWSLPLGATPAAAVSSGVVISQVYGGGGNSGATLTNDFIELFNRGTSVVDLSTLSVQYGGTTGNVGPNSAQITPLSGTIAPGQYVLIQEAAGAGGTTPLVPDVTDTTPIAMSATGGKVALVNSLTGLNCGATATPCGPTALAQIIDLVGYDGANMFEGAATPALTNTTAALRGNGGCVDTDNNAADFTVSGAPAPRNRAATKHFCVGDVAPSVALTTPASGANGIALDSNVAITFSEPVDVTSGWYSISCVGSGTHAATVSGGPTTYTLDPTADFAADENCTVTLFAANVSDQDLIDPPDNMESNYAFSFHTFIPPIAIHTIQGAARNSAMAGSIVTTTGVVTAVKSNGFFIQAPDLDVDADLDTSEGIFVFTGSSLPSAAVIGNLLQVTAKVQNFVPGSDPYSPAVTELSGTVSATVVSTGNPLPKPITLTTANYKPAGGIDQLVRYEGMRVHIDDTLNVVSPSGESVDEPNATATSTGSFYATFPAVARPFREPGIERPEPNPPTVDPFETTATHIPTFDANPERVRIDTSGLGADKLDISTGAQVTNITGALDFIFRSYSIYLTQPANLIHDGIIASMPVRLAQPYEFTVSSMNMERFFDTVNDPQSDAVLTATAFNNRVSKASLIVRNVLHLPDVVGVEEVEHQSTLKAVADKINADEVAAGRADPGYVAYLVEGNDVGGIDSGFLVKTSRVSVDSVTQYGKDTIFAFDGSKLNDRPPLVLTGTILPPVGPAYPVLVIVNHLRSLSGINGNTTDAERIRLKRRAQAEDLANLIQGFQTTDPNAHIISVGDYNAFQFNDGYVDGINTIKGTPTPADQVTDASPDLVNPDLVDVIDSVPADQRYSFMFDGNAQEIDHVLINQNLTVRFDELQYGRNNADFGAKYRNDPARPERLSDHDPIVAYFSFPPQITAPADVTALTGAGATTCSTTVDNAALGTPDVFGGPHLTVTRSPATNVFAVGATSVIWTATDGGGTSVSATQHVTVSDTTAPTVAAPSDVTRPGTGVTTFVPDADLGTPTASDNCGFTITRSGVPTGNLFPHGTTTITYTATDDAGNTATATQTVTIVPTSASVCATVRSVVANVGEQNSLCTKLDAAAAAAARGSNKAHDNQIQAFINEVNAQRGKAMSDADANTLIALAGAV